MILFTHEPADVLSLEDAFRYIRGWRGQNLAGKEYTNNIISHLT